MENDDYYIMRVDEWVAQAAVHCMDFAELLIKLPGIYPTTVAQSIERLIATGRARAGLCPSLLASGQRLNADDLDLQLPSPHPLDYDWRFSGSARELLMERCKSAANGGVVAFVGVPTLLAHARVTKFGLEAVLVDKNSGLIDYFGTLPDRHRMIHCDVATAALPNISPRPRVVVLDPPWYPEHMLTFLWAASELTPTGGVVLLSMPPIGTRPGIALERARVLAFAEETGLDVASIEASVLPYVSPPFEQEALKAAGMCNLPTDWRRGDLITLMRSSRPSCIRPPPPGPEGNWHEERLLRTRLRLRDSGAGSLDTVPSIRPVVPGAVLASVSRRDPRRAQVGLWTLGNRVFSVQGHRALLHVIRALQLRQDPELQFYALVKRELGTEELETLRVTIDHLLHLIEVEQYDEDL